MSKQSTELEWEKIAKAAEKVIEAEVRRIIELEREISGQGWDIPIVRFPKWATVVIYPVYHTAFANDKTKEIILREKCILLSVRIDYFRFCILEDKERFWDCGSDDAPRICTSAILKTSRKLPARLGRYVRKLMAFRAWLQKVAEKLEKHRRSILEQPQHRAAAEYILELGALRSIAEGGESE